ncbi:MAG TPA: hypothetical protein VKE71_02830 [Candidatus Angelobacter sp.]|nr:hypothetical protein [Candidatus Angelobacter sp.]
MRRFLPFAAFLSGLTLAYAAWPQAIQDNNATKTQNQAGHTSSQACGKHGSYTSTCNPFGTASKPHAIDKTCGLTGDAKSDGDKAQDQQKNNLCASAAGTPHVITIDELKTLQGDVDASGVDYGNEKHHKGPPANRADLFTKVTGNVAKEGDQVSFVGYIVEAKPGSSETVNCHCGPDALSIDVHMALADHPVKLPTVTKDKDTALCTNTFVAETIPHLRPASLELTAIQPLVKGAKIVKITGQLFFDGSHRPCTGPTAGSGDPARLTVWEIHPVYKIEVCSQNTLDQCQANSANWQPTGSTKTTSGHGHKGGKKKG